jgi:hypothetical protein
MGGVFINISFFNPFALLPLTGALPCSRRTSRRWYNFLT